SLSSEVLSSFSNKKPLQKAGARGSTRMFGSGGAGGLDSTTQLAAEAKGSASTQDGQGAGSAANGILYVVDAALANHRVVVCISNVNLGKVVQGHDWNKASSNQIQFSEFSSKSCVAKNFFLDSEIANAGCS
ncbi:MAG: hypothetical protein ACKOPT_11365, partial [Cyanobium sp.]